MSISVKISALKRDDLITTTERVSLPTSTGRIEILKNHIPLISALDVGVLELGQAGPTCERVISHKGLAVVLKNEVKIYLKGWEKAESRDEIASQLPTITEKVQTLKAELDALKEEGAKLSLIIQKDHLLGIEKARLDLGRRVGLSV